MEKQNIDQSGYTPEMVKEITLLIEKLKDAKIKEDLKKSSFYILNDFGSV